MYTIGQVSEMFDLPISTLRYYDKEGFFPHLVRKGNIRYFSNHEIEALHLIECLKKSGLGIKEINQFFSWVSEGSASFEKRKDFFEALKEAVEAGADIIMLDNMTPEVMKQAVELIDGRAQTECSGNITKENIQKIREIGVDFVSSGALTHSAPILDISMKNLHAV